RFKDGQFTPLPFDTNLSFRGDITTLEAFFRDVAQALFNAQPLTTVGLGSVSFVAAFGQPLVKEDLIFSAVVDRQNRLWVGTVGVGVATDGGLFRIVESGGVLQGAVQNTAGHPVAGADITIVGTPWRAVTDTEGRFQLENLPPGAYRLQVDGSLAVDGPFAQ